MRCKFAVVLFAITVAFSIQKATAAPRYRIEAIGPETSLADSFYIQSVGGLNDSGAVVLNYSSSYILPSTGPAISSIGFEIAHLIDGDRTTLIPGIGGDSVAATHITNSGIVVGLASTRFVHSEEDSRRDFVPFVYEGGVSKEVTTQYKDFSMANAANDAGLVVGIAPDGLGYYNYTAFLWDQVNGYQNLGNFGGQWADPVDVNARGDVLVNAKYREILEYGDSYQYGGTEALIVKDGLVSYLPRTEYGITEGSAINDYGTVVGAFGAVPGKESHAFLWHAENGIRDIGVKNEHSWASDINNYGVVVGSYVPSYPYFTGDTTAFIYDEGNGRQMLIDLVDNLEGWTRLESAEDINNRGQIVGIGRTTNDYYSRRFFLLTPIPEPEALAILLTSALSACARLRA